MFVVEIEVEAVKEAAVEAGVWQSASLPYGRAVSANSPIPCSSWIARHTRASWIALDGVRWIRVRYRGYGGGGVRSGRRAACDFASTARHERAALLLVPLLLRRAISSIMNAPQACGDDGVAEVAAIEAAEGEAGVRSRPGFPSCLTTQASRLHASRVTASKAAQHSREASRRWRMADIDVVTEEISKMPAKPK